MTTEVSCTAVRLSYKELTSVHSSRTYTTALSSHRHTLTIVFIGRHYTKTQEIFLNFTILLIINFIIILLIFLFYFFNFIY